MKLKVWIICFVVENLSNPSQSKIIELYFRLLTFFCLFFFYWFLDLLYFSFNCVYSLVHLCSHADRYRWQMFTVRILSQISAWRKTSMHSQEKESSINFSVFKTSLYWKNIISTSYHLWFNKYYRFSISSILCIYYSWQTQQPSWLIKFVEA